MQQETIQVNKKVFVARTLAVALGAEALSEMLPKSKEQIAESLVVLAASIVERMSDEEIEKVLSYEAKVK
ncbi:MULTISPECIES: hypothetical protein [unclassified Nostoc]|uniref:hypothetical protein n=1 Tax=unclassified Nostoc TaxID=2593658 RepID=UPI002AD54B18|nr:hypothetical protein [Nostoc sp. DedQUE03]MDZ7974737.1 hypothetical protein [Nostoc sp. DedQUE03]MDZ8048050.1 hypothetical protein [Nostoc sp. DedQUE02]